MRIRQIVFAARDLAQGREQIGRLFDLAEPFRDSGVAEFGIDNAVFAFGDQFIEVISPTQPGTACGRHLDRHGDCPYMLILQTGDFAGAEQRLDALGVRRVWRTRFDNIQAMHLHPKDVGGAIVSIDQPDPEASWRWGGPLWQSGVPPMTGAEARRSVRAIRLRSGEPRARAERWAQILGLAHPSRASQGWRLALQDGWAEFEPAPNAATGEGISGFSLAVPSVPAVLDRAEALGLPVQGNHVRVLGAWVELGAAD